MKKVKAFPLAAALACGFLLASCAGGPAAFFSTRKIGPFFISSYSETIPAHDDSIDTELDISFALADTNTEALKSIFRAAVYNGLSAEEYSVKVSDELKTAFRKTLGNNGNWDFGQGWTYNEEQNITLKEPFAVLAQTVYTYMGGAHGLQKTVHYVFDFIAPKQIILGGIVDMPKFRPLVDRELRRYSQKVSKEPLPAGKPLTNGIFNTDTVVPGDYFPAQDGIHLYWNPYEIAAYAYGGIEIVIPWKDLDGVLKGGGLSLAETFGR